MLRPDAMAPLPPPRKAHLAVPQGIHIACFTLIAVATAQKMPAEAVVKAPSPARALRGGKRKTALLSKRSRDPGFFRNEGVRDGVPREAMGTMGDFMGNKQDNTLETSMWNGGDSMSYTFPFLDNQEPIAPMDRLHAALGPNTFKGDWMKPMYVPAYLNPDAFPTVHGKGCNCTMAKEDKPIKCECGKSKDKMKDHYTWLKSTPVVGTDKYKLEPADISYRSGDYWQPRPRGGIVAPADVMPLGKYPNQAPADHIFPLPASAIEDRMPVRYARYIDQVQARSEECDTVSKKCTVPCSPGDEVVVAIGNTRLPAAVTKTFVGNAVMVEFAPAAAAKAKATTDCPVEAACTAFRICRAPAKPCVAMEDKDSHNWAGRLVRHHVCPKGTQVCGKISQVVIASLLTKGGKACRAAAKEIKKPPKS